jgi:hypothetical protein
MECLNRRCKVTRRRTSFHKGILGSPVEGIQEEDRWLGSHGEDLQNTVSRWIDQRSEEVMAGFGV